MFSCWKGGGRERHSPSLVVHLNHSALKVALVFQWHSIFFVVFFFSSFSSRSVGEVCAAGIVCSRFILCRKSWPVSQQSVWTNAVSLKRWILLGDTWREPRHVLLVSSSSDRTRGGKKKRTVEKKTHWHLAACLLVELASKLHWPHLPPFFFFFPYSAKARWLSCSVGWKVGLLVLLTTHSFLFFFGYVRVFSVIGSRDSFNCRNNSTVAVY